ncbi:hypothetical protein FG386_000393 [Cryptosporidium ryanae]|uniref:uncharacterized protein n=1 Tax=Cryptosporidium ryanae TaxID=515981 RepID=UPI00351A7FB8|nr:hypothetical protein FG386_000393 [Cryptosporidium ryanae]
MYIFMFPHDDGRNRRKRRNCSNLSCRRICRSRSNDRDGGDDMNDGNDNTGSGNRNVSGVRNDRKNRNDCDYTNTKNNNEPWNSLIRDLRLDRDDVTTRDGIVIDTALFQIRFDDFEKKVLIPKFYI